MLKGIFVSWLLLISSCNCSTSSILRIKPVKNISTLSSKQLGFQRYLKDSKVVPTLHSNLISYIAPNDDLETKSYENLRNKLLCLPDVLIEQIFEYLLFSYSNIRCVCKDFTYLFDKMAYRMVWLNFPGGTSETFSMYPKYKMIRLAPIFLAVNKTFKPSKEDLPTLEIVYELLNYSRKHYKNLALIAVAIFLKLKYIPWAYFINFDQFEINRAWSLGLVTIAKFLLKFDFDRFLELIGHESYGIVTAILNDRKALALYMIDIVRSTNKSIISAHPRYLHKIIDKCIDMRNWDVLQSIYLDYPEADYRSYLKELAKIGSIEGFHILKDAARKNPEFLAHIAAAYGNLDILQKLNELDILVQASAPNRLGETAVHVAIALDRFDCLVYLVERLKDLGKDYLNIPDKNGKLPIHLAAHFNNTKILKEIIRMNPRYKCKNPFKGIISPLHIAVAHDHTESVNILIDSFPELINYQDTDGDTVIHVATIYASEEMLNMLITRVPIEIIKARNIEGCTALHVAVKNSQIKKFNTLLSTNCFTGLERNCDGLTPIGLLAGLKYPKMSVSHLLDLFKITEDVFEEAIQWKKPSFFDVMSDLFNKS
jgi:ankyrin repeat protein